MDKDYDINGIIDKDEYTVTIIQPQHQYYGQLNVRYNQNPSIYTTSFTAKKGSKILPFITYNTGHNVECIVRTDPIVTPSPYGVIIIDRDFTLSLEPNILESYSGNMVVGYDNTTYHGSEYIGYNNGPILYLGSCSNSNIYHVYWTSDSYGLVTANFNGNKGGVKALLVLNNIIYNGYRRSDGTIYTSSTMENENGSKEIHDYLYTNINKAIPIRLDIVREVNDTQLPDAPPPPDFYE